MSRTRTISRRLHLHPSQGGASRWRPGSALAGLLILVLSGLLAVVDARPAAAQATLVKDINQSGANGHSHPRDVLDLGDGTILFRAKAYDGVYLYRSDGTPEGTTRVTSAVQPSDREIFGADDGFDAPLFLASDGIVYFSGSEASTRAEPWRSDGTELGTYRLADIDPGSGGSYPGDWAESGGRVYFTAEGVDGVELYTTDGTPSGTVQLTDIAPGPASSAPGELTDVAGTLFFTATGPAGAELWRSTSWGTVPVASIDASRLTALGSTLYFVADADGFGSELWKTDGNPLGTILVKDIHRGPDGSDPTIVVWNGALYLSADDGSTGRELWKSDGTSAGTVLVKDIQPGPAGSSPAIIGGDTLLHLTADDGTHGREPWASDGTAGGTQLLADINPGAASSASLGTYFLRVGATSKRIFSARDPTHGSELWITDGTPAGTSLLLDIVPGPDSPEYLWTFASAGGLLGFLVDDGVHGVELWATDGTTMGTGLVTDLAPGPASTSDLSYMPKLWTAGGSFYFEGTDLSTGFELWRSDGTAAGTTQVSDVFYATDGCCSNALAALGGELYFEANDGTTRTLWKSDGTEAGTRVVSPTNLPSARVDDGLVSGSTLYFWARDADFGRELWKTDGTDAGTMRVIDLNPGPDGSYAEPAGAIGGEVLFSGRNGIVGDELWATDGTAAGTRLVKDIRPGSAGSSPSWFVEMGGELYFRANDGVVGRELWKTDGTASGTVLVADVNAGPSSALGYSGSIAVVGSTLFFTADDGTGLEVWRTDGTAVGTSKVKDLNPSPTGSQPDRLRALNGLVFFFADDGVNGGELWKTDGTDAGTSMVANLGPGSDDGFDVYNTPGPTVANGLLFFPFRPDSSGWELWKTDGSAAGTGLVADIRPGGTVSLADLRLKAIDDSIYFAAYDGVTGGEPWITDGTPGGTRMLADIAPGPAGSAPRWDETGYGYHPSFASVEGQIFHFASDADHGYELRLLPEPSTPAGLLAGAALCRLLSRRRARKRGRSARAGTRAASA